MREKIKTLDKKENLKLGKIAKKQRLQERGITLIALVVTIIILLILAGVTLNIALSDNGLFNKTQLAVKKYDVASEQEAIEFIMSDIKTSLIIGQEIPNEKYIGDKLSEMSAVTGDWKNVTVGENTYKDGWYLVEKGEEITGYGEAKYNWLINYDTGEIIELKDGEYTIANANASGAIVDETLKLNIDPVNLQNQSEWGDGVSLHGVDPKDAITKSALKFDGIDDYLKIEGVNINKSDGITFEFYGYSNDGISLLNKTLFDGDELSKKVTSFRSGIDASGLGCCFGSSKSDSDLNCGPGSEHFIKFNKINFSGSDDIYISIKIDFNTNEISAYQNGQLQQKTTCSADYLKSGDVFKDEIPFTLGVIAGGNPIVIEYKQFDLYACRLYTRILSDTEISQNYTATTNYHNELIK